MSKPVPKPFPSERCRAIFWSKAEVGDADECWPWKGTYNSQADKSGPGVPVFFYTIASGKYITVSAYRVAHYFEYGSWPEKIVLPGCQTHGCVNTNHLVGRAEYQKRRGSIDGGPVGMIPPIPSRLRNTIDSPPSVC